MIRTSMPYAAARRAAGFSLIELMVTVAIVGILAAVAYPAYGNYLARGHRAAAQAQMLAMALAQSQYLADSRGYAATPTTLGMVPPAEVSARYTISIAVVDGPPPTYTITATPVAGTSQAADGVLSIDSAGTKLPTSTW
ncbi:type IV pilin protein [Massilia psychrophila]|jgi:type IV pilus assembly protein PilE|nr:type IV pilin protein [Massilia psychrophila]GGE74020.1 pilus assembly protein PilE [Massilia psychrophila]